MIARGDIKYLKRFIYIEVNEWFFDIKINNFLKKLNSRIFL